MKKKKKTTFPIYDYTATPVSGIDYKLLEETIDFPLWIDPYGGYVWSKSEQMIANFESEFRSLFTKSLEGAMKTNLSNDKGLILIQSLDFYLINEPSETAYIGCVRGWGDFQYEVIKGERVYNPERGTKIQDNLALYLLACLNS